MLSTKSTGGFTPFNGLTGLGYEGENDFYAWLNENPELKAQFVSEQQANPGDRLTMTDVINNSTLISQQTAGFDIKNPPSWFLLGGAAILLLAFMPKGR